jgi:hypothetical protein
VLVPEENDLDELAWLSVVSNDPSLITPSSSAFQHSVNKSCGLILFVFSSANVALVSDRPNSWQFLKLTEVTIAAVDATFEVICGL